MNNRVTVEEAKKEIVKAYNHSTDGVAVTNMGLVAVWVLKDTVNYLETMLRYGHWKLGGLQAPVHEVKVFASYYGVEL